MQVTVLSFAKINIGLAIGRRREDGFHELRTLYQTIALSDRLRLEVQRGTGIDIRCKDVRVPADESNTCYRMAERVLKALKTRGRVAIQIEKQVPPEGGLGGSSSNAAATLLGLQRALKRPLPPEERLRLAAEVGSDVPLFLVGGTVLGLGRGEQVYPLEDLPPLLCVVATPALGVSTAQAFADWDSLAAREASRAVKLTESGASDRISTFSRSMGAWLGDFMSRRQVGASGKPSSGVPAGRGDRAEALLLDLVRTGIENDFERVVFPQHPELRDVKRVLYGEDGQGARYASLSGSGSSVYGLFDSRRAAQQAVARLKARGVPAQATSTLPRAEYWRSIFD